MSPWINVRFFPIENDLWIVEKLFFISWHLSKLFLGKMWDHLVINLSNLSSINSVKNGQKISSVLHF